MDPAIEVKQEPVSTSAEESTVTDSNNPQTLAVSAVSSHVSRPANSVPISAAGVAPRLASVHIPSVITPRKELSTPVRLILEPNIGTAIPSASQQSVVGMNQQTVLLGTSQFVATASPRKLVTVPVVPTAGSLRPLARPMVVGVRNMQPVLQPLPVTLTNSPGKLNVFPAPRLQPSSNNSLLGVAQQATKAPGLSPYKVVIRSSAVTNVSLQPVTVTMPAGIGSHPTTSTNLTTVASPIVRPLIAAAAGLGNVQQLPVSGSKFQYVRLVAAPTGPTAPSVTASPAKGVITVADGSKLVAVGISDTVTAKFNEMLRQKSGQVTSAASMPLKRMILPATTATLSSSVIGEITKSANMNNASSQMLKAAKEFQNKDTGITLKIQLPSQVPPIVIKPEAAAVSLTKSEPNPRHTGNGSVDEPSQKPRKPCNCTKSQCLKLYCDCFANGEFCNGCNCCNCANNLEHEDDRLRAIRACLERNPLAFHPKIGKGREGDVVSRQHAKGCNCKRSGCLKNYCECFEAKIPCSNLCRCFGCKNYEDDLQHKTLMHLADAAEVRVLQQVAANSKLATPFAERHRMNDKSSGKRPAYSFVTTEVVEATCACLIATLEDSSAWSMPDVATEKLVLEEFGRCLLKVIESANGSSLGI